MAYPKCQHCGHSRTKHKIMWKENYCHDCWILIQEGPQYDWEYDKDNSNVNYYHNYHPDNLSYIEKLAERKGLV